VLRVDPSQSRLCKSRSASATTAQLSDLTALFPCCLPVINPSHPHIAITVLLSFAVAALPTHPLGVHSARRQHAALSKFLPSEPAAQSACDSGATGPWYVIPAKHLIHSSIPLLPSQPNTTI